MTTSIPRCRKNGLTDPSVEGEIFPFSRPQLQVYFRRGDSNADDKFDLNDALHALGFMFLGEGPALCKDATDANDSGALELGDAIMMLNRLFLNGPPLPPPGATSVGPDPTLDGLDCRP